MLILPGQRALPERELIINRFHNMEMTVSNQVRTCIPNDVVDAVYLAISEKLP